MAEKISTWRELLGRFGLPGASQLFEKLGIANRLLGIDSALLQTFLGFISSYMGIIGMDFIVEKVGGWLGTPLTDKERKELEQMLETIQRERGKLLEKKIPPLSLEENGKFCGKLISPSLSASARDDFLGRYTKFSPEHQALIVRTVIMFDSDLDKLVNDEATWMVFISQIDKMVQQKEDKDGLSTFDKFVRFMEQIAGYGGGMYEHLLDDTTLRLAEQEAKLQGLQKQLEKLQEGVPILQNPFSPMRLVEIIRERGKYPGPETAFRVVRYLLPLFILVGAMAIALYK